MYLYLVLLKTVHIGQINKPESNPTTTTHLLNKMDVNKTNEQLWHLSYNLPVASVLCIELPAVFCCFCPLLCKNWTAVTQLNSKCCARLNDWLLVVNKHSSFNTDCSWNNKCSQNHNVPCLFLQGLKTSH